MTIEAARRSLEEYLRVRGLRVTPERLAMVDAVGAMTGHFTIEQLAEELDKRRFPVSRATLYNNINTLCEAGLVWRHPFETAVQFERSWDNTPHFHCICRRCGSVQCVTNERWANRIAETRVRGFKTDLAYVYISGLCNKCAATLRRKDKKLQKK